MRIAELYQSIQGEGSWTGTQSVFIRASGCNLRCWFCDTPHTSWHPEGADFSVDEILRLTSDFGCRHAVITGGEPMLFAELIPLCQELRNRNIVITIETAGTLYLPIICDLMSISPKLRNSTPTRDQSPRWSKRHERTRQAPEIVRRLIAEYPYQLKFVVDKPSDCEEIETYLQALPDADRNRVWLMPQGIELERLREIEGWLRPYCRQARFQFCPRKHIEWFGFARGT